MLKSTPSLRSPLSSSSSRLTIASVGRSWELTEPRNAELKEYIASGVSKEQFMTRMKSALPTAPPASIQPPLSQPAPPQTEPVTVQPVPTTQPNHAPASIPAQAAPPTSTNARVQAFLDQRAAAVAEKKNRDETATATAAAVVKKPDAQSKHAEALKKKQREAREERQRILKAIEDDKVARKAQKAEAESIRRASMASENRPDSALFAPARQSTPPAGKPSEHCALRVRLFDGSTIRNRFSSNDTLKDVRKWVNETREDGKLPFVFKVLLTPLPSRTVDIADETKSLQELELAPSSTLILLRPARKYKAGFSSSEKAAAGEPQRNVFQRLIAFILAIINGFLSTITSFLSNPLSPAGPSSASGSSSSQTSQSQAAADAARRRGGKVAGLDHADERRNEQQFYNGNSVGLVRPVFLLTRKRSANRSYLDQLRAQNRRWRVGGSYWI